MIDLAVAAVSPFPDLYCRPACRGLLCVAKQKSTADFDQAARPNERSAAGLSHRRPLRCVQFSQSRLGAA
jgi:hypothetical protein